jgi:hypothetical protein
MNPSRRDNSWAQRVLDAAGKEQVALAAARAATVAAGRGQSSRKWRKAANDAWKKAEQTSNASASTDAVAKLLTDCPVPDEELSREVGDPLFMQTVAKTAAVATAAATSLHEPPAAVKPMLSTARTVTLSGYRAVNMTRGVPRWLILSGLAACVVGVFMAVQHVTWLGIAGTLLILAGAYLLVLGAWGLRRRVLGALIAITIVVAVASSSFYWTRRRLFGNEEPAETGWVDQTVIPWLRDSWWAPLIVVGAVVVVLILVSLVAGRSARRTARRRRDAA